MSFIEMQGKTLLALLSPDEIHPDELRSAGLDENSLVRINRQGDIELRIREGWDVIGGLIGDFEERVHAKTGLDWA